MADLYSILAGGHDRGHIDGLDPSFRSALQAMLDGAPPEIAAQIGIQSGYRSPERQAELYQAALKKYGSEAAARKWVAPPGKSQHNHGNAVDLKYASPAAEKWAHENAKNFGLNFRMGHEPWHIEPIGGHDHGQPQGVAVNTANSQAYVPPANQPIALGADGRQAAAAQQMQMTPATPAQPAQTQIGNLFAGLGAMPAGIPQLPQTDVKDIARVAQAEQASLGAMQSAEKAKGLKSAFMPDLESILRMSKRPV